MKKIIVREFLDQHYPSVKGEYPNCFLKVKALCSLHFCAVVDLQMVRRACVRLFRYVG